MKMFLFVKNYRHVTKNSFWRNVQGYVNQEERLFHAFLMIHNPGPLSCGEIFFPAFNYQQEPCQKSARTKKPLYRQILHYAVSAMSRNHDQRHNLS